MAEIRHIGSSSLEADLFEGQYPTPEGMAYNSYIILDEKVAVLDTADAIVGERWKERLRTALGGRKPDYLVVQHLEPDHSALIGWFAEQYPEATVVLSARASQMLPQFFRGTSFKMRPVKEGDTLSLGQCELRFIMAPMVH
ncbi:MAG: FprA family A-type flavoprotein, partial [Bacteroidales bacterium]|nr:FprA family A-type flavoprotein [Bacteroidales bacterium]